MSISQPLLALKSSRFFVFILFFLILFLVYSPLINGFFLMYDDYGNLFPNPDYFGIYVSSGRPLSALNLAIVLSFFNTIGSAFHIRLAGCVFLALFALSIYALLRRLRLSEVNAFLIALMVATLPSWTMTFAWVCLAGTVLYIPVTYLIYVLVQRCAIAWMNRNKARAVVSFLGASGLFVALLCLYQIYPFYFWIYVGAVLLYSPSVRKYGPRSLFLCSLVLSVFSVGVYMGVFRLGTFLYKVAPTEHSQLTKHPFEKFGWFVNEYLWQCLNFWNVYPVASVVNFGVALLFNGFLAGLHSRIAGGLPRYRSRSLLTLFLCLLSLAITLFPRDLVISHLKLDPMAWVLGIAGINAINIVLLALTKAKRNSRSKRSVLRYLESCFLVACTIPLSWTPVLVSKGQWPAYRVSLGPCAILLFCCAAALWAVLRLSQIRSIRTVYTLVLTLFMLTGVILINRTAAIMAEPSSVELRAVMAALSQSDMNRVKLITYVVPPGFGWSRNDEILVLATHVSWSYKGLTLFALRQLGIPPPADLQVRGVAKEELKAPLPDELVIDTSNIISYYKWKMEF